MKKLSQPPVFCLALLILDEKGNCTFLLCHGLGLGFVSFFFYFFVCLFFFFLQSVLGLWSWPCAQSALRKIIPTTVYSKFHPILSILFYSTRKPMAQFLIIYSHRPSSISHRPSIHQTIYDPDISLLDFCPHTHGLEVFPVYSLWT